MTLPWNVICEKKNDWFIDNLDTISCSASQILNKHVMSNHLSSWVQLWWEKKFEPSKTRNLHGNEFDVGKQFWLWKQDKKMGKGGRQTHKLPFCAGPSDKQNEKNPQWVGMRISFLFCKKTNILPCYVSHYYYFFASKMCNWFRVKKSLHFASNAVIFFVLMSHFAV